MKHTILLAESAAAPITEGWPTFPPGGDKKNGHWIALAAYTDGPRGPKVAELREALTKKLSGRTAEAKRGSTTFKSPLLPKLREVYVRGAEIPGVSPNSMNENSDLLLYVVEFDTYMPKLFEIAEDVLEDLVLSKKDLYDWANGPVESGYSAVYSAAKQLRLDVDSVYSTTDARQQRYMGEAVDPEVFGEFRSFLASPYLSAKANGARPSFLFSAAVKLGILIKKYGDEARDVLVPYADGVMSRVDAKYRTIGPYSETSLLMGEGGKYTDNVEFVVDFIKKHHSGLQIDTFNIDQTDKLDLFMSLNLGPGDGRIHFITEKDVIESKRIGELMEFAYSNGRKEIDISSSMPDIAGVAHDLKFLSTVIPSGASVVFKAYSLSNLRGVPVRSLVNGVLRRRKIKGTNKKLKAEISFHQLQRTSGGGPLSAHAAILDDAVSQDIIHSYIIAGDTLVLVFN